MKVSPNGTPVSRNSDQLRLLLASLKRIAHAEQGIMTCFMILAGPIACIWIIAVRLTSKTQLLPCSQTNAHLTVRREVDTPWTTVELGRVLIVRAVLVISFAWIRLVWRRYWVCICEDGLQCVHGFEHIYCRKCNAVVDCAVADELWKSRKVNNQCRWNISQKRR